MSYAKHSDPAEHNPVMRLLYRDWKPTMLGRWVGRMMLWWCALGLPSGDVAVLEVRGRVSGRRSAVPLVIATVAGQRYLVSMLGPESNWVKNVEAANGEAILRHGRRVRVHLVPVPIIERPPILEQYVRIATSGRRHLPIAYDAPLAEFQALAERYPVYRIDQVRADAPGA
jgi:hypothetical protein